MLYLEKFDIQPSKLMKFLTGSERMVPLEQPKALRVFFKHDCDKHCKCFLIVSTCAYHVTFPVHIQNDGDMKNMFVTALQQDSGFGRC